VRAPAILGACIVLVAACSASEAPPEVTFATDGNTVVARPTQLCDVQVRNCTADPSAAVVLRVPPGQPVEISVPKAIGETPWLVVFGYRTKAGERINARSNLFAGNERLAYTLTLPSPNDQLETVEVQQVGGTFVSTEQGIDFPTRGTWVLSVDDRG
jgi:Protein of unknown function (DUF2771)